MSHQNENNPDDAYAKLIVWMCWISAQVFNGMKRIEWEIKMKMKKTMDYKIKVEFAFE